jgi:carotenoid 1,2-hydratase
VIAQRFFNDGRHEPFEPPERHALPRSAWRVERHMRSDRQLPPQLQQTLEDTPFYARSVLRSGLLGESVVSVHESLSVPRLVSRSTRFMLPWRMPRRAGL